jgi:hypothetical protein
MKSPYADKNGIPLNEGDLITGYTNFDKVQGFVTYEANGIDDYDNWKITITKSFHDNKWLLLGYPYTLYLAYHLEDGTNKCKCYEKIEKYLD